MKITKIMQFSIFLYGRWEDLDMWKWVVIDLGVTLDTSATHSENCFFDILGAPPPLYPRIGSIIPIPPMPQDPHPPHTLENVDLHPTQGSYWGAAAEQLPRVGCKSTFSGLWVGVGVGDRCLCGTLTDN